MLQAITAVVLLIALVGARFHAQVWVEHWRAARDDPHRRTPPRT